MNETAKVATVDTKCGAFRAMEERWELLHDLQGGTRAMRDAGRKWLPQEPKEKDDAYSNRLKRSFLYGAFSDAVDRIVAKPFSSPVTFKGATLPIFEEIRKNADQCGSDLTLFARCVFEDAVVHGLSHILVDHPATGGKLNAKQERELGVRPYFVHVKATQLIGWRTKRDAAGRKILTQARIYSRAVEPIGEYDEEEVERVRVITETRFEVHERRKTEKDFTVRDSGEHTFGGVPLVTLYTSGEDFEATPPLEDLAWMNLAHWQSASDQRNILRFARVGILFGSGFTEEEAEKGFAIGPTNMILSTNPEARLTVVEHSGKAIGAGKEDLEELEAKMDSLGLRPFVDQKGNPTATGKLVDEQKSFSSILAWIRSLELALLSAFRFAAQWRGETASEEFEVDVFSEFGISVQTNEAIQNLITMRANRELSRETFLNEVKRRGLLADTVKVEDEIERIESEPPPPGTTPGFGGDAFDDDPPGDKNGDGGSAKGPPKKDKQDDEGGDEE